VKASLSSHALSDQARADYMKKGGDVGLPGSTEGAPLMQGLADYDKASGGEVGGGVHDILQGNVAKGLHRIISGVGSGVAPMAAVVECAACNTTPGHKLPDFSLIHVHTKLMAGSNTVNSGR
jgi:hypothetical protein